MANESNDGVQYQLGSINAQLTMILQMLDVNKKDNESLGTRVTALETWKTRVTAYGLGALAVVGLVWSTIKFLIPYLLKSGG